MDRGQMGRAGRWAVILTAGASLAACASLTTPQYDIHGSGGQIGAAPRAGGSRAGGTNAPYQVGGIWYVPHDQPRYDETGIGSWYGDAFQMKATADGEIFDMNQLSAAHTTLPLPSMVEVTNLDNGRKLTVRVNDRGPFVGGRIIDLSRAAAQELGYERAGTARVRVRYVGPAPLAGPDAGVRYARASSPPAAAAAPPRPVESGPYEVAPLPPPVPIVVAHLPPLPGATTSRSAATVTSTTAPDAIAAFRIQAGAFSDQDNARRAAARLAGTGTASVEPFERGGTTLYRVVLPGPTDEAEAFALRDKVAQIGFSDARVLRP